MDVSDVIKKLDLMPMSIEGGYFRETYRCEITANTTMPHSAGTLIYYLLSGKDRSAWHKVNFDEVWIYNAGVPAVQMLLFPDGKIEERIIGPDIEAGHQPQSIIPANTWQAAIIMDKDADAWGLFSAVVIPGFENSDFTLGNSFELLTEYPYAKERMEELNLI